MTPKEAYEVRKAEREKLKGMEYQVKHATETVMLLDTLDRFVTAVERIADAMTAPVAGPTADRFRDPNRGCVCPAGTEVGCGSSGCPRRSFRGFPATC